MAWRDRRRDRHSASSAFDRVRRRCVPGFCDLDGVLHLAIWTWWYLRGRDILFVYSDSPIWREHVEQHILPYLGERAVVLNWSHRKRWRISIARLAFHYFGGSREFNPLAVVFRPMRRTRTFRFWQPFRDFKHGRPEALRKLEHDSSRSLRSKDPGSRPDQTLVTDAPA